MIMYVNAFNAFSQNIHSGHGKSFKFVNTARSATANIKYFTVGVGASIWHLAEQQGFINKDMPFHGFVEKGKLHDPLSFQVSYNFNARYQLDSFTMRPQYISLLAKYNCSRLLPGFPANIDLFAAAGVQGWMSGISNTRAIQSSDQSNFESHQGIGYVLSTGITYYYKQLGFGAQLLYYSSKGKYNIGDINDIDAFTGSTQLNLTISYRILVAKGRVLCPIYKRL